MELARYDGDDQHAKADCHVVDEDDDGADDIDDDEYADDSDDLDEHADGDHADDAGDDGGAGIVDDE